MVETYKSGDRLTFKYDYMGRRVEKCTYSGNTLVSKTLYVYDGFKCVEELDGLADNAVEMRHFWQPFDVGLDVVLATTDSSGTSFFLHDANKNVMQKTSANGTLQETYAYAPFGESLGTYSAHVGFSSEINENTLQLIYYNYRYYTPIECKWLSRDPIEENGVINLMEAFGNNAIDDFDLNVMINMGDIINKIKIVLGNYIQIREGISKAGKLVRLPIYAPPPIFLEVDWFLSGDIYNCRDTNTDRIISFFQGSLGIEGYVSMGYSLIIGNQGKGKERNQKIQNPNNPNELIKRKKAPADPQSGFRERSRYIEFSALSNCCPREDIHFSGSAFLRGSIGVGYGRQINLQKRVDNTFTDIFSGWSMTGGVAWGLTGVSIEGGNQF
jgi:RHS repeat-associated protein